MSVGISLAVKGLLGLGGAAIRHHDHLKPSLKAACRYPFKRLRVSCAALLSVCKNDRYLLVRSRHRPETFGPIGGVFKYFPTAERALTDLQFEAQTTPAGQSPALDGDLRGYIPAMSLPPFLEWLKRRIDREQSDCIRRELREETSEAGHPEAFDLFSNAAFNLLRTIHEGPDKVPGMKFVQFRYLEIYCPLNADDGIDYLYEAESGNPNIITATKREIQAGRTERGAVIGSHSAYLFGKRRFGAEPVPMVGSIDVD